MRGRRLHHMTLQEETGAGSVVTGSDCTTAGQ